MKRPLPTRMLSKNTNTIFTPTRSYSASISAAAYQTTCSILHAQGHSKGTGHAGTWLTLSLPACMRAYNYKYKYRHKYKSGQLHVLTSSCRACAYMHMRSLRLHKRRLHLRPAVSQHSTTHAELKRILEVYSAGDQACKLGIPPVHTYLSKS